MLQSLIIRQLSLLWVGLPGGDIQPLPWRKGLLGRPSLVVRLLGEAQWHRRRSWSGSCRWQRLIFQGGGSNMRRRGTKWHPIHLSFHVSFPSTYATAPMGTTPLHPTATPALLPLTSVEVDLIDKCSVLDYSASQPSQSLLSMQQSCTTTPN